MTKTEAREYALKVLAAEVRHHAANGSDWLEAPHGPTAGAKLDADGRFSDTDYRRVKEAVDDIADMLEAASKHLARSRIRCVGAALRRQIQKAGRK